MDLTRIAHLRPPAAPEPPAFLDPDFVRAADWLARSAASPGAVVVGAPFGGGSISGARCDEAPGAIRRALSRFSVWSSEHAVSLDGFSVLDAGDVVAADSVEDTQLRIAEVIAALDVLPVVLLGGDNSVTVGGARGVDADALMTFDAHHDCRDPAVRVTNGSPVRQLVDGGLSHVVQIGIHGFANAEANARWALDHKIHVVMADHVRADGIARAVDGGLRLMGHAQRIWVDVDLDVLDRAFAPGAPAAMPGGLTPADLQAAAFILGREPRVAGLDLTEIDPTVDVADTTVRAACSVMLSFLAGVASR